ncbi:TetR/AcrR family transcriptional regulator [Mycolicibacter kumamotonensis]|jgi:AcrR family transcriptional regulator|uniref:TetR family transcriptional regulator n=1 Tax=Mycolicibacter kumamotonensis TaxID=354243 RepID=A0A1B8SDK0_9MYCO|nr:TetR/AcrR family transcriptional regulator [Mycolicibacter kumamotonensis]NDJ89636.1 TetR/AcrR family transcriptional regulator [Mycolicibacter kumamotonensis]OBY30818.1 TetR family transcriptional regulator [Mycolicibacter kumamotonensis]ORA79057.1 TetR family transcriptional regulator [Mycolicibacter kumamotonensis]
MLSTSNDEQLGVGDRILDAAASCLLALGVERVTLAAIARRAGVSRPTVYRRWRDSRAVIAALLTARVTDAWTGLAPRGTGREALVDRIVGVAARLRRDEVVMQVLHHAPDLAMVYIAERMGASQRRLVDLVGTELANAQGGGGVRTGDPRQLAAMCLLITQSAIQSAQIVAPILDEDALAAELTYALNRYLS